MAMDHAMNVFKTLIAKTARRHVLLLTLDFSLKTSVLVVFHVLHQYTCLTKRSPV
jgi:hypothetical protein